MLLTMFITKKKEFGSSFRSMKINTKNKGNFSNCISQRNRFLAERTKIIFKNLECVLLRVFQ